MLLAVDVGNTNIVLAVYRRDTSDGADRQDAPEASSPPRTPVGSSSIRPPEGALVDHWRIRTDRDRTTDELGMLVKELILHCGLRLSDIRHVAISSVVPTTNETLAELSRRYFCVEPMFVNARSDSGINILYQPATDVGADRICNAVGAFAKYGGPAIVVDFGTATTFDAIADNGDYIGGAILPGIGISMDALFKQAARLYRVEFVAPPCAIGDTTVHAMQSGLVFGFAGQTDAMVERFRQELGGHARVIATGGHAELIHKESRTIEVVDQLVTLDGLRLIFERQMATRPN